MPSSAKQFLPFVREKFPRLAKQYEQWYAKKRVCAGRIQAAASERVARIREKYGFRSRPWVEQEAYGRLALRLSLGWDAA